MSNSPPLPSYSLPEEKRQATRWRADDFVVHADCAGHCLRGKAEDISESGFRLSIPRTPIHAIKLDAHIRFDIYPSPDQRYGGTGSIAHILDSSHGIILGVEAGDEAKAHLAVLTKLAASRPGTRGVHFSNGHVSHYGAGDLGLQKDLRARLSGQVIDLSDIAYIDGVGVALLALALERGSRIRGCPRPVAAVLNAAGVCRRCDPNCTPGQSNTTSDDCFG